MLEIMNKDEQESSNSLNTEQKATLKAILLEIADYTDKLNANILSITQIGGDRLYSEVTLKGLKELLNSDKLQRFVSLLESGDNEKLQDIINIMSEQSPKNSYDTDIMDYCVSKIRAFVKNLQ